MQTTCGNCGREWERTADSSNCPSCGMGIAAPASTGVTADPFGSDPFGGAAPPPLPGTPASAQAPAWDGSATTYTAPPASSGMSTTAKVLIGVGAVVVLLFGLGAVAVNMLMNRVDEFVDLGTDGVFFFAEETDLPVGSCFDESDPALAVSCDSPHSHEVFGTEVWTGGSERPDSFDTFAVIDCDDAFDSYVGIDYFESAYFYDALPPTTASWDAGDRNIRCVLYEPGEILTSSARNARR